MLKHIFIGIFLTIFQTVAIADEVDMRDFIKLTNGMSEAEILYILGPYDHETIKSDRYHYIFNKTWYYIPSRSGTGQWISEFKFNGDGILIDKKRYKTRN